MSSRRKNSRRCFWRNPFSSGLSTVFGRRIVLQKRCRQIDRIGFVQKRKKAGRKCEWLRATLRSSSSSSGIINEPSVELHQSGSSLLAEGCQEELLKGLQAALPPTERQLVHSSCQRNRRHNPSNATRAKRSRPTLLSAGAATQCIVVLLGRLTHKTVRSRLCGQQRMNSWRAHQIYPSKAAWLHSTKVIPSNWLDGFQGALMRNN